MSTRIVLLSLALGWAATGHPQERIVEAAPATEQGQGMLSFDDGALDASFARLRTIRDPDEAQGVVIDIRRALRKTPSATIDMLMNAADAAAGEKRFPAAFDFLDQVIVLDPLYAEGWNRRATLHFVTGNYRKSMSDIAEVLRLEPRHLGALSGMAGILAETGRKAEALKVWQRYLELYPADRAAQTKFSELSEEIAGQKT